MEMVDMGITRFWIWGPKSRSVNNSSPRSDFGLFGLILDPHGPRARVVVGFQLESGVQMLGSGIRAFEFLISKSGIRIFNFEIWIP
jgi:hypothetical protein